MSSEPEMSDARFSNLFSLMIGGLIVLTIVLIILAVIISSGVNQSDLNDQARDAQLTERIKPAGQINIGEVASSETPGSGDAEAAEAASGEDVYQQTCAACHASGVAGAPTFGDPDAWSDRLDQGTDTLYQHSIEGFQGSAGVMPPRGGNDSLSDEAVKAAVDYMVAAVSDDTAGTDTAATDTAGTEAAGTEAAATEAAATEAAETGAAESDVPSGESVYQNSCIACHGSGVAGAPRLGDSEAWTDRIAQGKETLYQHSIEGFQGSTGMMPPKGGNTSLSDEAVMAAVDYMVAAVSDDAAGTDTAGTDTAGTDTAGTEAAESDVPSGESVYQNSCIACHGSGVAGAPRLGDSEAWTDRIAQGKETLYQHSIEGFQGSTGMMPPKGGNTSLSHEAVKAAVDYMVEQAE